MCIVDLWYADMGMASASEEMATVSGAKNRTVLDDEERPRPRRAAGAEGARCRTGALRERALGGAHVNHNNVQRYYTITLLLSALPVSTMSAPGTPDPAATPGYMAAQQDHSPVTVHHHAVIPAPSTPVLPVHQAIR